MKSRRRPSRSWTPSAPATVFRPRCCSRCARIGRIEALSLAQANSSELRRALSFASICAAFTCGRAGADPPRRSDVGVELASVYCRVRPNERRATAARSCDRDRRQDDIANLKVLRPDLDALLRGSSDPCFIHVRALGRLHGADLDRDHRAEADQANKNKPDDASHDASRRYRTDRYRAVPPLRIIHGMER